MASSFLVYIIALHKEEKNEDFTISPCFARWEQFPRPCTNAGCPGEKAPHGNLRPYLPLSSLPVFREGETIAIYGAGDVGRKFYQQAKDYGCVKCVVIVDENAENIDIPGIPVAPVGALKQFKFDKVLISMTNETSANEARESLIRMGFADERIK